MQVTIQPADLALRPAIEQLVQLWYYDLSAADGSELNDQGRFDTPSHDEYWAEEGHYPFLIRANGQLAGFALVNRKSRIHTPFDGHTIAALLVVRKYRRQGVGRSAATQIFDRLPGRWEIGSHRVHSVAHAFWRSVLDRYTGGQYIETWVNSPGWAGPVHSFEIPTSP